MIIGLTLVAFGTSAPEMLVSGVAAFTGAGALALGNVLGSNIANIGLILGITALIAPIPLRSGTLRLEVPLLLIVTLLVWPLLLNGSLSPLNGVVLLALLTGSLFILIRYTDTAEVLASEAEQVPVLSTHRTIGFLIAGLVVLVASSRMLVWGAVELATLLGISELIIGLTLVAVGTSLPELAASVASALKGHHDMALGNIVGSNLFNLLLVLSIPAFIGGVTVDNDALYRDYGAMVALTIALALFAWFGKVSQTITRLEGGILLAGYTGYSLLIFLSATGMI